MESTPPLQKIIFQVFSPLRITNGYENLRGATLREFPPPSLFHISGRKHKQISSRRIEITSKMSRFAEDLDEGDIEEIIGQSGLSKKTLALRATSLKFLDEFLTPRDQELSALVTKATEGDIKPLQEELVQFFCRFRVMNKETGKPDLPKKGTLNVYKSHIKLSILQMTDGRIDVTDKNVFKKLNDFFMGYDKTLKEAGKADTKHTEEIPASTMDAIYILFGKVLKVLECRGTDAYDDALEQLPDNYQDTYHELLQMSVIFSIMSFDIRRGREGLCKMTKDTYVKKFNDNLNMHYYLKTRGELSKNHQADSEDLQNAGIIPFFEDGETHGYNPGRLMEFYLETLHENCNRLFQRPNEIRFKFDIHKPLNKSKGWFTNAPVGKHKIEKLLPNLCKIAGAPHLANHSIRASGIRALKRAGFEKLDISRLSGHKNIKNLNSYDAPTEYDKTLMALSVQHGHQSLRKGKINPEKFVNNDDPKPGLSGASGPIPGPSWASGPMPGPSGTSGVTRTLSSSSDAPKNKRPSLEVESLEIIESESCDKENQPPSNTVLALPTPVNAPPPVNAPTPANALDIIKATSTTMASVSASVQTSPTNVVPDAVLKLIMHEQVLEAQKIQQTQKSSASAELVSKLLDCYRPNK